MQLSQTIPKPLDPLRLLWIHRFLIRQLVERESTVESKRSHGGRVIHAATELNLYTLD